MKLNGLSIAGPKARDVLAKLVDQDVSNESFRFMDFLEMDVAGAPCFVNRISYTGDLGYEIWMSPDYERLVYAGIKDAGAEFGIKDFGMRALLSMRLEKNFPTWFAELRPIYGPYEGAMDRFVKLSKNDFIGRDAAATEKENGGNLRRVSFLIEDGTCDVMGDEPIWAKTSEDLGTIEAPKGYGVPRRDADGNALDRPDPQVEGDWRVVGWVTSGGYGHYVKSSMAQGYVPWGLAENGDEGFFEIEILGERRKARIALEPPFDPKGERMRG